MNAKDELRLTLIDLMDEQDVTGNDLAKAVGVTKQAVSAWRTGKSSIDIENVPAICKFFGISIDEFFGGYEANETNRLSDEEREVVMCMRDVNETGRIAILSVARVLASKSN